MGIRSRGIVVFGTISICFSSFVQWWFSSPAMLPEMVASWAVCLGCMLVFGHERTPWKLALAAFGFVGCGLNFVLCLYPPFQIPLLFLGFILVAGLSLDRRGSEQPFHLRRCLILLGSCGALILVVLIPFWIDTRATLQVLAQTEYPAHRHNSGGGYALWQLFSGPIGFFESESRIPPDFPNICEASNFYPFWPLALLGVIAGRVQRRIPIAPSIILLTGFLIAVSVYCVVQLPEWLLHVTLFSSVHEARALLSIGLANILLVCLFLDRYREPVFDTVWGLGGLVASASGIGVLYYIIQSRAPDFFADRHYLALLIAANAAILTLFFWDRMRRWLPALVVPLLVCSNGLINPVMRSLAPLLESPAFRLVDRTRAADPNGKWIAYGQFDHLTPQLVKATGAQILNGTKIVPDLPFLRELDPERVFETVYNRYAWIMCAVQVFPEEVSFSLLQAEFYRINLPPGLPLLRERGYNYFVFREDWADALFYDFSLAGKVPEDDLWIYRRDAR